MDGSVVACCFDQRLCRLVGLAIGWLGILISIMVIKVFTKNDSNSTVSLKMNIYENIIVVMAASNFLACCCWLFGLKKDNRGLLRATLIWLGINLCLAILCICCYFFETQDDFHENKSFLLTVTVYWLCSFVISVLYYKSKKASDRRDPKQDS